MKYHEIEKKYFKNIFPIPSFLPDRYWQHRNYF